MRNANNPRLALVRAGLLLPDLGAAPLELQDGIREFFPESEWLNAAHISWLESGWDAFAVADTRTRDNPCGSLLRTIGGVDIFAELSVGYFQLNFCDFPTWEWQRGYNARHNCGTANAIWADRAWAAWYYSARALGLL